MGFNKYCGSISDDSISSMDKSRNNMENWNNRFPHLSHEERLIALYELFTPQEILVTSSFGASSPLLLHLIAGICPEQPIHFLDTSYHFEETLAFRDRLIEKYRLNVVNILPDADANQLTREEQWWFTKPDACCDVNKVKPLATLKGKYKVWISGIMGFQTPQRSNMPVFENQNGLFKFNPFIDLTEGEYLYWSSLYKLPEHPLTALGFESIGCMPCTSRGQGRNGRWAGKGKIECGLHL
ncbi:MAG: phosphoadenylyl-sulfate reductase [Bacteroidetes bacterium]|nr:phosphoadenylyl-sulfate reductase [Bacteroidota bacterium]